MAGGRRAARRGIGGVTWHGTSEHEGRGVADTAIEPARDKHKAVLSALARYAEWWTAGETYPSLHEVMTQKGKSGSRKLSTAQEPQVAG